jgi:hypothetical protein
MLESDHSRPTQQAGTGFGGTAKETSAALKLRSARRDKEDGMLTASQEEKRWMDTIVRGGQCKFICHGR